MRTPFGVVQAIRQQAYQFIERYTLRLDTLHFTLYLDHGFYEHLGAEARKMPTFIGRTFRRLASRLERKKWDDACRETQ